MKMKQNVEVIIVRICFDIFVTFCCNVFMTQNNHKFILGFLLFWFAIEAHFVMRIKSQRLLSDRSIFVLIRVVF